LTRRVPTLGFRAMANPLPRLVGAALVLLLFAPIASAGSADSAAAAREADVSAAPSGAPDEAEVKRLVDDATVPDEMRRAAEAVAAQSIDSRSALPPNPEPTAREGKKKGKVADYVGVKQSSQALPKGLGAASAKETEVTLSVPVDDTTKVRGGLRVDHEIQGSHVRQDGQTMPTFGIEKKF
jgi:hypothetical protein